MNPVTADIILDEQEVRVHFYFAQTPEGHEDFEIVEATRIEDGETLDLDDLDDGWIRDLVLDAVVEADEKALAQQDDYWENRARMELV